MNTTEYLNDCLMGSKEINDYDMIPSNIAQTNDHSSEYGNNNSNYNGYNDYIDVYSIDESPLLSEIACDLETRYWETKEPSCWSCEDVWSFLFSWSNDHCIDINQLNGFTYMNGGQLCSLSKWDFISLNQAHGEQLYHTLQSIIHNYHNVGIHSDIHSQQNLTSNLPSFDLIRNNCFDSNGLSHSSSSSESDRESTSSSLTAVNERNIHLAVADINLTIDNLANTSVQPAQKNVRRGRPPKKDSKSRNRKGKVNGKLWEFIRDLLLDSSTNPSLIRWERREDGIFKFVQSDKVAKLWGQRKQNPRMTYEKLSRAMRYYYKSQVLLPVFGRRLVYKFGPNATGWRPTMPLIEDSL